MTQGRLWIVVGLVLLVAPGCGLQHVAEWLVVRSAEKSNKAQAPVAQQPAAPPVVRPNPGMQRTQPPAWQPEQETTDLTGPASVSAPGASTPRAENTRPATSPTQTPPAATSSVASAAGNSTSTAAADNSRVGTPVNTNKHVALRYGFKDGESYHYKVQIEAELPDGSKQIHYGTCVYTAKVTRATPVRKTSETAFKPTATAFVVSPDGYLLTCHHVVDDAEKLEVAIAGQTYTARVIDTDPANDLAIIKIEATGLKTVPLADSDRVEVGQEVRAIGFPLSSILGDSLKATRGTISGIENRNGRPLLQVDASINPGNSGGPLVSEGGDVVAIASAKLAGSSISNVGFAVPINEAKRLLARHQVQAVNRQNSQRLEGPALVRSVSPAVALVTVASQTIDPREGEQIALKFTNTLTSTERQSRPSFGPPRFPRMRPPPSPFEMLNRTAPKNEIVIDAGGNILEASGGESLPFMLGNMALFVIEPLPSDGERQWETERSCTIHEKKANDDTFGPGFIRPPSFGRFGPRYGDEEEVIKHPASEVTEYSIGEPEGGTVAITKVYELKTEAAGGKSPYLQLTGDGEITFDIEQGIPLEMTYDGTVSVNKQNVTVRIPLTVSYKRLTDAEVAEAKAAAEKRAAELKAAMAPKPIADDELPKLLAKLESTNNFDRQQALDQFAKSIPSDHQRAQVAAAIGPLVNHKDRQVRNSAIPAIAVWGSGENLPVLIEQLASSDPLTRGKVMEAMGKLKDERAVEPLCEKFKSQSDRHNAAKALEQIGAPAEKGLLPLLDEGDWVTRMEVCRLLEKIGTPESLPQLEKATQDSNGSVKHFAKSAIEAINKRQQ